MKCPDCNHENLPGEEVCETCNTPLAPLDLPRPKGRDQRKILEGTLADLKPRDAIALAPDRSVAEAVKLMRTNKTGCVLITQRGELKGIFTERDLLMEVAGLKNPSEVQIAEVMKRDLQCLEEEDPIALAFHSMALKGFRHIPVRRKNAPLGIISSRDLLRYLCQ